MMQTSLERATPASSPDEAVRAGDGNTMGALKSLCELEGLNAAVVEELEPACVVEEYGAGETVFTMGQADDALYAVLSGEARMTRAGGERGDIAVDIVAKGDWIGLISFALEDGAMSSAAVQAVGALRVLCIDGYTLRDLAARDPGLALALMRLCAKAARGREKTTDPNARVYRYLAGLVTKSAGGAQIAEMPRHAAVAEAAGVSDVEAAGAVADLISRGIAKRAYPGLTILDTGALERAAFD